MTSSLVGSEMCIRDRLDRYPVQDDTNRDPNCMGLLDGPLRPAWTGPVSYTHLTLPTICSV
eukprot:2203706-Prorocentrum_lima.AAC.1